MLPDLVNGPTMHGLIQAIDHSSPKPAVQLVDMYSLCVRYTCMLIVAPVRPCPKVMSMSDSGVHGVWSVCIPANIRGVESGH